MAHPATRAFRPKWTRAAGFSLVSAVFIVVVLALLATAVTVVISLQARSSALDIQSARAYQSARAGLEWGAFQVLRVSATCFASKDIAMTGNLAGFTASVSCSSTAWTDGATSLTVYRLVANACNIPSGTSCPNGATSNANYVERQLTLTVSR